MKPILLTAALLTLFSSAALAQYKVIGADGSVTYTDRPPVNTSARITEIKHRGEAAVDADASLPFELRQVATRFPVTLYTTADCPPCDAGRRLLQQRGVPYSERRVVSDADAAALERAVGGRTVPALTIGAQALRGLSETDWSAYLDAAGYPRESQLPANWQPPVPTALVQRAALPALPARPAAATPAAPAAPPAVPQDGAASAPASKIRF